MASAATACMVAWTWEYRSRGDADLAVAEQVAHDLGVDALAEQQRCAAVAQVVEADGWQASADQPAGRSSGTVGCWG